MVEATINQISLEGKRTSAGIIGLLESNGIKPTGNAAIDIESAKKVAMLTVTIAGSPKCKYKQFKGPR